MALKVLLLILVAAIFCVEPGFSGEENKIPKLEDVSMNEPAGDENQSPNIDDNPHEDGFQDAVSDFEIKPKSVEDVPGLTEDMLAEAMDEAKKETEEDEKRTPRQKTKAFNSHYRRFVPELEPARIKAMVMERTIKRLATKLGMTNNEAAQKLEGLQHDHLKQLLDHDDQENDENDFAYLSHYRSISGEGNNAHHPYWGQANSPFRRIIRAEYGDGVSTPRRARNGRALPNARKVSSIVFKQKNAISMKLSHMAMIWGQFLDHDIALGAQPNIDCSGNCGLFGECFGIRVPAGDTPFRSKGKTCIELKRDVPATGGRLGPREQVNQKSAFIDASQIYGDDPAVFHDLRLTGTPFLRSMNHPKGGNFKDLLPKQIGGFCRTSNVGTMPCFKAGDERINENAGLGSMHTIWLREHNRIATELKKLNSHWSVDKVFYETRKIVGAMVQHITYNEFLPLILNNKTRTRFQLDLKAGFYYGYNEKTNPTISNSFAAAAYRFGHSLVQNQLNRFGKHYQRINPHIPMNRFFDPTFLYQTDKGGVDSILRGLAKDRSQRVDTFFAKAVQEQLVRGPGDLADLPALNIQRAREHGVPGYNAFRKWANGLPQATTTTFQDLSPSIPHNRLKILKKVYRHPDDIDLFVGGLYEKPLAGAVLGKVFSFILAEQFRRLRRGDRFWYENPGIFTTAQLKQIRKVKLSGVICRSSDNIRGIQSMVLTRQGKLTSCSLLQNYYALYLKKWKESPLQV